MSSPAEKLSPGVFRSAARFPVCLLLFLLLSPGTAEAVILRGPVARIPVRSIRHRETLYIPVASIARAWGLVLEEEDGRTFVFGSDRVRLRLQAGSREIEINGEAFRLEEPVDWVDGTLIAPIYLALVTLPRRAPFEEPLPELPPAEKVRIVLDPGHGGVDPGAVGEGMLLEKSVVLEIALAARDRLEEYGYRVFLTRSDDRYVSLRDRARTANRLQADLFISIHANTALNRQARGTETFYYAPASDLWSRAVALMENAALRLESAGVPVAAEPAAKEKAGGGRRRESIRAAAAVQRRLSGAAGTPNRGIKAAEFYVLKHTRMPSILVETGFLSNHQEREFLADRGYRRAVADAIARGIRDYLEAGTPNRPAEVGGAGNNGREIIPSTAEKSNLL